MKRGEPTRRPVLPTLLLLLASGFATIPPGAAQHVLEEGPGAVRIWESSARVTAVAVAQGRIVRAAVAAEGGQVIAGEDLATGDLFFVLEGPAGSVELPTPPRAEPSDRACPVLLTRHGRLDGAVWLEGSSPAGLAVMAAVWNGTSWEKIETVAPANGRPQLAPAAAVLADGTWIAVWAGFDGQDDEVYWSRRRIGTWSPPRRLHRDNRVPDLLPALIADGDGVLAAWSFYDGSDYRVRAARFAAGEWRVGGALAGLGAGYTHWQQRGGRSFVTYRTVVPAGWSAVELDSAAGVVLAMSVKTHDPRPPLVEAEAGSGAPRLVWPYDQARPRR